MPNETKRQKANGAHKNSPALTAPAEPPAAFKLKAACKYLGGISPLSLHRLIRRGLIRPNRSMRHLLFSRLELDRFANEGTGSAYVDQTERRIREENRRVREHTT
jgi:hypothetical protein